MTDNDSINLQRIATALERIADALCLGDDDHSSLLGSLSSIADSIENLDTEGLETYEQN